jgi:RNA polymerase sigma-70 factor (ECF subfamily)
MDKDRRTFVVQKYLDERAGAEAGADAELLISALLGRATRRLQLLCASLLYRSYPRLARPPLGLEAEEMLGAVVERLLRALRQTGQRRSGASPRSQASTCVGSLEAIREATPLFLVDT